MRKLLLLAAVSMGGPAWAATPDEAPVPDAKNLKSLLDTILPNADELKWKRLGWRSEMWAAAKEARALQRPILLWAMNGHPLACT